MIVEKSCGAILFREGAHGREYLILTSTQGHTTLCKGHVEEGESERETARREIREETGLEVEFVEAFRYMITYSPYRGCTKDVVFFLARVVGGTLCCQPSEVAGAEYLPFEEASARLTHDSDRQTLALAHHWLDS